MLFRSFPIIYRFSQWKVNRYDAAVEKLLDQFEAGEFDVIAVGRALLADPNWVNRLRAGDLDEFAGFDAATALARLY